MNLHKINSVIIFALIFFYLGIANSQNIDVSSQSYTLTVALKQSTSVEGINLVIEFDENIIQFKSATLINGFLSDWQQYIQVIQNKSIIALAISGDHLITGSGAYASITFNMIGPIAGI